MSAWQAITHKCQKVDKMLDFDTIFNVVGGLVFLGVFVCLLVCSFERGVV